MIGVAQHAPPGLGGEAIACLTLLAVVLVPIMVVNWRKLRALWAEIRKPIP